MKWKTKERLEREFREEEEKENSSKNPIPTNNPRKTPVDKYRERFIEYGDDDVIECG
jgi:hypothetical protein